MTLLLFSSVSHEIRFIEGLQHDEVDRLYTAKTMINSFKGCKSWVSNQ